MENSALSVCFPSFYMLKKSCPCLFLGPSPFNSFRDVHLMVNCVESSLHFWVLSDTWQNSLSFHPVFQHPQTHGNGAPTAPAAGGPWWASPPPPPPCASLQSVSSSMKARPLIFLPLRVCRKQRPPAALLLDSPFCTSLSTGGDPPVGLSQPERLHVGVARSWWPGAGCW